MTDPQLTLLPTPILDRFYLALSTATAVPQTVIVSKLSEISARKGSKAVGFSNEKPLQCTRLQPQMFESRAAMAFVPADQRTSL